MLRQVILLCLATAALGTPFQGMPRPDGRIVGGIDGSIEANPYMLSLQIAGKHECGATIVNEHWALTAAQCVGGSILGLNLRSGTINRVAADEDDGTPHKVTKKIVHPNYNPVTSDSDIALLEVDPPFVLDVDGKVGTIKLPDQDSNVVMGFKKTVTGWGNTHFGGVPAEVLQAVEVTIVNRGRCTDAYDGIGAVTENMICAGDMNNGGFDACQGDSGGPLVTKSTEGPSEDVIVGIVSWGRSCAQAAYPGVYTKVSSFSDWIIQNAV